MPLPSGLRLGNYEITALVGAGAMGEVYRAHDFRLGRDVAIKVLPEAFEEDAERLGRFEQEARTLAALSHPNVVQVFDVGEHGGRHYLVMELLEGETLRHRLETGQLPWRRAVEFAAAIADGLAAAHAKGIIHRDLKPENLVITRHGHLKILDFGLAKLSHATLRKGTEDTLAPGSLDGAPVGTAGYMAPEQVRGLPADARSDLFSVGCLLFEMLTGTRAFGRRTTVEAMAAILRDPVPDPVFPSSAGVPELDRIVRHCLEKAPSDRFHDALDLSFALKGLAYSQGPALARGEAKEDNQVVIKHFPLSERVCGKLNRASLDPRMIGDHLTYADNQVRSQVLVIFLHGLGLDHRDFEAILRHLPYRGMSPTLYGCEPERRQRTSLSLADHIVVLREWLRSVVQVTQPARVVLIGFSLGADMGFELLLAPAEEPLPTLDAFLALECNLSIDTCFVSRVLARIGQGRLDASLGDLSQFGTTATSLDEWLNIHEYLVKVLRKFQHDIGVLQRAAADIVALFEPWQGFEVFVRWFKGARARVPVLRLVFSDSSNTRNALSRLKLMNLENGILGEEFPEGQITVSPDTDHFELMATERILRQVEELLAAIPVSAR